jgi:hypothetical protein
MLDINWVGVIEKYLNDGDSSELEKLVRKGGVPIEYGNKIADILTGKSKPLSAQKSLISKRIKKYKRLLNGFKEMRKLDIGNVPKKNYNMQLLAQYIYTTLDKDDARNELYKLIRKHKLSKLKD